MTSQNKTGAAGQAAAWAADAAAPMRRGPLFEPFDWSGPETPTMVSSRRVDQLAGCTLDVANGVAVLVEMFEREELDSAGGDEHGNPLPPLLPDRVRGDLLRLAVTSLRLLAGKAMEELDVVARSRAQAPGEQP